MLAELDHVVSWVDHALENFDTVGSGRILAQVIDEVSNWYIRRCRARFWNSDQDALATLYECLQVLTRLLAPFVPFITEQVWQRAIKPGDASAADSVHLATWPSLDPTHSCTKIVPNPVNPQLVECATAELVTTFSIELSTLSQRVYLRKGRYYRYTTARLTDVHARCNKDLLDDDFSSVALGSQAVTGKASEKTWPAMGRLSESTRIMSKRSSKRRRSS